MRTEAPLFGAPFLPSLPYVAPHLAVDFYNVVFFVINRVSKWGFLSSVSPSNKLIEPEEGVVGTSDF